MTWKSARIAAVVALLAGLSYGLTSAISTFWPPGTIRSSSASFESSDPMNVTAADRRALVDAWAAGTPIDPQWTQTMPTCSIESHNTGIRNSLTGERLLVVAITDGKDNLASAEVLVNGVVVATASPASGGIVQVGEVAVAQISFWAPDSLGTELEARWASATGSAKKTTVTY